MNKEFQINKIMSFVKNEPESKPQLIKLFVDGVLIDTKEIPLQDYMNTGEHADIEINVINSDIPLASNEEDVVP